MSQMRVLQAASSRCGNGMGSLWVTALQLWASASGHFRSGKKLLSRLAVAATTSTTSIRPEREEAGDTYVISMSSFRLGCKGINLWLLDAHAAQ